VEFHEAAELHPEPRRYALSGKDCVSLPREGRNSPDEYLG
jgi:hypothetical protein